MPPPPDEPEEEHPDLASTVPTPRAEPDDMAIDVDVDEDVEVEPEQAPPAGEPQVAEGEEGTGASPEQLQDFFRQSGSGSAAPDDKRASAPPMPPPSPDRDEEDAGAPPSPPEKGKRVTSQGVCDVCARNPVWSIQHQRWYCEHCQRII
jgi:hypothetical protein